MFSHLFCAPIQEFQFCRATQFVLLALTAVAVLENGQILL